MVRSGRRPDWGLWALQAAEGDEVVHRRSWWWGSLRNSGTSGTRPRTWSWPSAVLGRWSRPTMPRAVRFHNACERQTSAHSRRRKQHRRRSIGDRWWRRRRPTTIQRRGRVVLGQRWRCNEERYFPVFLRWQWASQWCWQRRRVGQTAVQHCWSPMRDCTDVVHDGERRWEIAATARLGESPKFQPVNFPNFILIWSKFYFDRANLIFNFTLVKFYLVRYVQIGFWPNFDMPWLNVWPKSYFRSWFEILIGFSFWLLSKSKFDPDQFYFWLT